MVLNVDLAGLAPADALDLAVLIEEEGRQRYIELSELMDEVHGDREAAAFFAEMSTKEEAHGRELWSRREASYPDAPHRIDGSLLDEIHVPDSSGVHPDLSARGCLEIALAAERAAEAFFRAALPRVMHPEVRALFTELADEEVEHQALLAARIPCPKRS